MSDSVHLLEQFDLYQARYGELCERVEGLLRHLLHANKISVHSISSRVKARDSLSKKIGSKGKSYRALADITDVAGVRIVTYFSDQVDEVAGVVQNEFDIDRENSTDKRKILDPDRFGYLSLHYVALLSPTRKALAEYKALSELKVEIQIRSILQHAWAEIEHDLGYKTPGEVPKTVRRQFARLAGMLELADDEFVRIRQDLFAYSATISEKIVDEPSAVELDRISLVDFSRTNPLVLLLDTEIASAMGYTIRSDEHNLAANVGKLQSLGLTTIADVKSALEKYQGDMLRLAKKWAAEGSDDEDEGFPGETISEGVSLFYLGHVLAGATGDVARAHAYIHQHSIGSVDQQESLAQELVNFMRKSRAAKE